MAKLDDNLNENKLLSEKRFENSFFNHCFFTEINHLPSKYSSNSKQKLTTERKDLLQNNFYRKFSKIIIGAPHYLEEEEIKEIFGITDNWTEIILDNKPNRTIKAHKFQNEKQIIICCNQLSGSAGWTKTSLENLAKHLKRK